jgi:hypothetical protein
MYQKVLRSWIVNTCLTMFLIGGFVFTSKNINVLGANFTATVFNDTQDVNPGNGICADSNGQCSLRAGIEETNAFAGPDVLNLVTGTYVLEEGTHGIQLNISDDLEIRGAGSQNTMVSTSNASSSYSIFNSNYLSLTGNSNVNLSRFEIQGDQLFCQNAISIVASTGVNVKLLVDDLKVNNCSRGLDINGLNSAEISNSVFEENRARGIVSNSSNIEMNNIEVTGSSTGVEVNNPDGQNIARINDSKIHDNIGTRNYGGGVYFSEGCNLSIADSLYITNTEIYNNSAYFGGGIYNKCGHLDLENVTIANNTATNFSQGGGLYISYSTIQSQSPQNPATYTAIRNSTISGNTADLGGAIYMETYRDPVASVPFSLDIMNTTIANNNTGFTLLYSANSELGQNTGIEPVDIRMRNSLLANNGTQACFSGSTISQTEIILQQNTIKTNDFITNNSLTDNATCATDLGLTLDITLGNFLGPLQDNGGVTRTHALLEGGSAINGGSNTDCPEKDQRDMNRPNSSTCDVGAYEFYPTPVTSTFSGKLFIDLNQNGAQDSGDIVLINVPIEILDSNGVVVLTIMSNDDGNFNGILPLGDYTYRLNLDEIELTDDLRNKVVEYFRNQAFAIGAGSNVLDIALIITGNDVENVIPTVRGLIRTGGF